ncbi:hypothetical protein B296_00057521 [Ensete ventricosum]|uniref:Uncharacterized protein n=1 Tax=Ensete ventricosum TaxID=4639 RepID=A0A426XEN8_ENSVE|nr:hypothetical protein B296_00057521 [Ensete ventricosum]
MCASSSASASERRREHNLGKSKVVRSWLRSAVHEVCVALAVGRPYPRKVSRTYARLIVLMPGYRATPG